MTMNAQHIKIYGMHLQQCLEDKIQHLMITLEMKNRGVWLAQSEEFTSLGLKVMSSPPKVGVQITKKIN